jgi:hypothetical protein
MYRLEHRQIYEAPHTIEGRISGPLIELELMVTRILLNHCRRIEPTDEMIKVAQRILIRNFCKRYGNSNLSIWRIVLLEDEEAMKIMIGQPTN